MGILASSDITERLPLIIAFSQQLRSASAEGVGAQLARDLPGTGSKTCARGLSDKPRASGFRAAAQPIATVVTSDCSYALHAEADSQRAEAAVSLLAFSA
jgi:hypothetical protein